MLFQHHLMLHQGCFNVVSASCDVAPRWYNVVSVSCDVAPRWYNVVSVSCDVAPRLVLCCFSIM